VEELVTKHDQQELATPGRAAAGLQPYTTSLPKNIPASPYVIKTASAIAVGSLGKALLTVWDENKTTELLLFEAYFEPGPKGTKIREALVYRAGDYPVPAYRVIPKARYDSQRTAMVLTTYERTMLREPINEVPDREGENWADRRFAFGGRRFVRKPFKKRRLTASPEAVYEYTTTTQVQGTEVGKLSDDALPIRLWWHDPVYKIGLSQKYYAAAGLDPLFKEYLFVAEMMKRAVMFNGASPAPTTEDANAQEQVESGWKVAKVLISLALALAAGSG